MHPAKHGVGREVVFFQSRIIIAQYLWCIRLLPRVSGRHNYIRTEFVWSTSKQTVSCSQVWTKRIFGDEEGNFMYLVFLPSYGSCKEDGPRAYCALDHVKKTDHARITCVYKCA